MRENVGEIIAFNIRRLLDVQDKKQSWLANEMGIQAGYLSELLNGHPKKRWNEDLLEKARNVLGVPLHEITMQDEGEKSYIQTLNEMEKEEWAQDEAAKLSISVLKEKAKNNV